MGLLSRSVHSLHARRTHRIQRPGSGTGCYERTVCGLFLHGEVPRFPMKVLETWSGVRHHPATMLRIVGAIW
jgi:hypothetical protein